MAHATSMNLQQDRAALAHLRSLAGALNREPAFPDRSAWYVLFSALDVICTRIVLWFGGAEVNSVAARIIEQHGLWGMVALKFCVVSLVISVCEYVAAVHGSAHRRQASLLMNAAIALSVAPVFAGLWQLTAAAIEGALHVN